MNAPQFYKENIDKYNAALSLCKSRIFIVSVARLITFVAIVAGVYYLIQGATTPLIVFTVAAAIAFIITLRIAFTLNDRKKLLEELLFVNNNETAVLNNQPNAFYDGGKYANANDYSGDLDIFGPSTIYHLLNRCTTHHGKEQLAHILKNPFLNPDDISLRQKAVAAFSTQPELRQQLLAHGLLNKEEEGNLHSVSEWLNGGSALHTKKWLQVVRWIFPVYAVPAFIYYIDTGNISFLLIGLAIGWILTGSFAKYIYKQHQLLSKKQEVLQQYADILRLFKGVDPGTSVLLGKYRDTATQAFGAIGKLSKLSSLFDQRLNLLVNIILNSLFLYDLQCILMLDKWKSIHKTAFADWLHTVGDIECLNALATLAYNNPSYQYPIAEKSNNLHIQVQQMAHPLIAANERVANDFEAGNTDRMLLVTGSNMSGKTTFLRTLGVNILLGQCGAPVCASYFSFTPLQIYTSIRVSDSLQEHTSYFMAELKRLKQIIQHLKEGRPSLVLIDEILRGTNSEDKTHGSEFFIKQLIQYNCITLFATHDLMLSSLENEYPGVISNYCFESTIKDDTLYFDYTLQKGVAKNKNATFLMKQMGIIGE